MEDRTQTPAVDPVEASARVLLDRPELLIAIHDRGEGEGVLTSFFARHAKYRERPRTRASRFLFASGHRHYIFVHDFSPREYDAADTWANITATVTAALLQLGVPTTSTYGHSSGASAALSAAAEFPVDRAVAVSPLWSADPCIAADPVFDYPERVSTLSPKHMTVESGMKAATRAIIFHGDRDLDALHSILFPVMAHVEHWQMPGCCHNTIGRFREAQCLTGVIRQSFDRPADMRARRFAQFGLVRFSEAARDRARLVCARIADGILDQPVSYLGRSHDTARRADEERRAYVESLQNLEESTWH